MAKLRIGIPTKKRAGLKDVVSEVFGKARTFTLVDVEDATIKKVRVIDNPAVSYPYGSGPVAVKTLADMKINMVLTGELGLGASELLDHHKIKKIVVNPDMTVADSIREAFVKMKEKGEQ
ncbi:MAG: NifB/NifX family molybdenum-iron cluster-binding protein [Candidatus Hodarchaeota archaeon]